MNDGVATVSKLGFPRLCKAADVFARFFSSVSAFPLSDGVIFDVSHLIALTLLIHANVICDLKKRSSLDCNQYRHSFFKIQDKKRQITFKFSLQQPFFM
jgi:hypothetical protein